MRRLLVQNETGYDGRGVSACVRFVFRELDLSGDGVVVKVKHHNGAYAYQGRIYFQAWGHGSHVYNYSRGEWAYVAPRMPMGYNHLIVCRLGKPGTYPCDTNVYDRKDSPGTWTVTDWREALVAITAHEATHLRQYLKQQKRSEVETEWAAYRLWARWVARRATSL